MAYFNSVTLAGNAVRDPEIRYTRGGTAVCELTIAVNERRKKGTEWVDEVNYFECSLFAVNAENTGKYVKKGDSVLIDGKLKQDKWEDSEGRKQSTVRILVQGIQFLSHKFTPEADPENERKPVSTRRQASVKNNYGPENYETEF